MRVFRKWLLWEGHVRERQQPSQHQGRLQSSDDLPSVAVPLPLCCGSPIARAKEERETIQLRESSLERVFRKSKGEQAHTPKPSFLRRHNKQRKPSLPLTMISVKQVQLSCRMCDVCELRAVSAGSWSIHVAPSGVFYVRFGIFVSGSFVFSSFYFFRYSTKNRSTAGLQRVRNSAEPLSNENSTMMWTCGVREERRLQ